MAAFEHVLLLLSFIYVLALTHLLARVGNLIVARERVRLSGLGCVAILNAAMLVYSNWLGFWDLRGARQWGIVSVTTLFAFSVTIYFICSVAAPEPAAEGSIDMEAFYWRNRRPFYALIAVCMVLAILCNFAFLKTPNTALFFEENAATLPFFVPSLLALFVSARWAQWIGGVGLLALTVGVTIAFSSTLS